MESKKYVMIPTTDGKAILQSQIKVGTSDTNNCFHSIGIVVTHPMPLLGGNLWNNVVKAVCDTFNVEGATTLCFNFRGVGDSTGSGSWQGEPERVDVLSCCKYLLENVSQVKQIGLVGYSYGSVIASSVSSEMNEIIGYVSISYPFGPLSFMLLGWLLPKAKVDKPKYFIISDQDNFTSEATFMQQYNGMPEPKSYDIIHGGDHFWGGNESSVTEPVKEWVRKLITDKQTNK